MGKLMNLRCILEAELTEPGNMLDEEMVIKDYIFILSNQTTMLFTEMEMVREGIAIQEKIRSQFGNLKSSVCECS